MYLEHFGLREAPFRITPHTEFFFAGAKRGATLEALIYAITHDEGIVKVSGEVGSGKTMLCRMLLEKLPPEVETIYLANPTLAREDIHHAIAEELHTPLTEARAHQRLRTLQDRLLALYSEGRKVVVMIDEAHAMPSESLEEIRLLSNLESNTHKLLHIVLFGQPELDQRLARRDLRQLKERITHNFALEPLRRDDMGGYLMFRLRAAGYRGPDLFTPAALQLLSKVTQGLTRRINILADKALLAAFSENKHLIDRRQVQAAARDAQFTPMSGQRKWPLARIATGAALCAVAAAAFWVGQQRAGHAGRPASSAPQRPTAVFAPAVAAGNASVPNEPTATAAPSSATPAANVAPATAQPATAGAGPGDPPTTSLAERIAATERWLSGTPADHYFIQLMTTDGDNESGVEQFLARDLHALEAQQIRVYRSSLSGRSKLGVIYGDYPTHESAAADLAHVAAASGVAHPYLRSVNKLR